MNEIWRRFRERDPTDPEIDTAQWQRLVDQKIADSRINGAQFRTSERNPLFYTLDLAPGQTRIYVARYLPKVHVDLYSAIVLEPGYPVTLASEKLGMRGVWNVGEDSPNTRRVLHTFYQGLERATEFDKGAWYGQPVNPYPINKILGRRHR